jgi:hypothetical protein
MLSREPSGRQLRRRDGECRYRGADDPARLSVQVAAYVGSTCCCGLYQSTDVSVASQCFMLIRECGPKHFIDVDQLTDGRASLDLLLKEMLRLQKPLRLF